MGFKRSRSGKAGSGLYYWLCCRCGGSQALIQRSCNQCKHGKCKNCRVLKHNPSETFPTWTPPTADQNVQDGSTRQAVQSSNSGAEYVSHPATSKMTNDTDGPETIYSVDSIHEGLIATCVNSFSRQLSYDIPQLLNLLKEPGQRRENSLSNLLKSFAKRLLLESSTRSQREISEILNKYRRNIVELLGFTPTSEASCHSSDSQDDIEEKRQGIETSFSFIKKNSSAAKGISPHQPSNTEERRDTKIEAPNIVDVQEFIENSNAYQWLLSAIKAQAFSKRHGRDWKLEIGKTIRDGLSMHPALQKATRQSVPVTLQVIFQLKWDIRSLVREQEFTVPANQVLDSILCLTGTWQEAQGATVAEYLEQTWPFSHVPLKTLLQKFLACPEYFSSLVLPNEESLKIWQYGPTCKVVAKGSEDFVVDIGEQLGWIASALRSSPSTEGVVVCAPRLTSFSPHQVTDSRYNINVATAMALMRFDDVPYRESEVSGFCWSNAFKNPVLVSGYPILPRRTPHSGLELSLPAIANLTGSYQLAKVNDSIFFKGFSSLLVATNVEKDEILWHYVFEPRGQRISYLHQNIHSRQNGASLETELRDLPSRRHIIGWCREVKELSGHPNANLSIISSGLRPPPNSIGIDKLYLEAGSTMVGGAVFSAGRKDKPVHLRRSSSYRGLLDWVSTQSVLFQDVEAKRAWLTDGASALLHLVRASIERDKTRPVYQPSWRFHGLLEGDSSFKGGVMAAMKILCNISNLNTVIYIDDVVPGENGQLREVPYYFRSRVQEILHDLEVIIDYQMQVCAQDGYWIPQSIRIMEKKLVGFDFWDVAKPIGPIRQQAYYIEASGHGWVDYVRSIGAITIFGKQFGELLQPGQSDQLCPLWMSLPVGLDLMGTTVDHLKRVAEARRTDTTSGSCEVAEGIHWSSSSQPFSPCSCLSAKAGACNDHRGPIQLLLPKGQTFYLDVPRMCTTIALDTLEGTGAVAFGHTPNRFHPRLKGEPSPQQDLQVNDLNRAARTASSSSQGESSNSTNIASTPPTIMTEVSGTTPVEPPQNVTDVETWFTKLMLGWGR